MKTGIAQHGSGKTYFNKIKQKGESWIMLRDKHIAAGKWKATVPVLPKENKDKK